MNPFGDLNYRYPGTPCATRPHVSCHPPGPLRNAVQNPQSMKGHTRADGGYACSDFTRAAHALSSSDLTPAHVSHLQPNSTPIVPRPGAVHSDITSSMKPYYVAEPADLSDRYVPSSSDRITCADHRPLDEIFGNIRSSTERTQSKSGPICPPHNGALRGHPQRPPAITYPLPMRPQLERVVRIPLLTVGSQMNGTGRVVNFRCSDWGIGVQMEGIPMTELLHGKVTDLENPHQRVLDGLGLTDLRLSILWPHYPPFAKAISAFGRDGKPISRVELGYEVSLAFAEFFYQLTSQSLPPAQAGPYTISVSTGSTLPGIKFDQLHLIAVRNTSRGEWVAEIRAVSVP